MTNKNYSFRKTGCLLFPAASLTCSASAATRPNIIFIMADDLGYGDLGCYGQKLIQRPRIDRMAAEGMRFTHCYAGAPVCAPSRSVLMTGQHTGHTRVRDNTGRVGGAPDEMTNAAEGHRIPLLDEDITVADVLKKAGYATGITGKWGLGEAGTTGVPNRQGFGEWYGFLCLATTVIFLAAGFASKAAEGSAGPGSQDQILRIDAPGLAKLNFELSTGGLPIAPGLETYTVIRSDKEHPERAEGLGWTYQHHPDIAAWHGRLYVGWDSCERDEDTWPSRELYSSSADGKTWAKPQEMFPQGVSTPLRMYFFHAPNGHMLIIAGLRTSHEKTGERTKGPLVVRELRADHSLGDVFTLRPPAQSAPNQPPAFVTSADKDFVRACEQLLADRLFLLQQDYGSLLDPPQRMKWNDPKVWDGNAELKREAGEFGKAMCFFERKHGAVLGLSKKRWVTVSHDGGQNWDQPVRPESFVSGMGKAWGQRTSDGRYALIYNPHAKNRWPLAMLTSDDGITFRDPHALHGELPGRRYEGEAKNPGASYHRGLNKWNNDGSWKDDALWMVYSLNKEEIRVIRVPLAKGAAAR